MKLDKDCTDLIVEDAEHELFMEKDEQKEVPTM